MFQLEIFHVDIFDDSDSEDTVEYLIGCRPVVGDLPTDSLPVTVWLPGTDTPAIRAFLSYVSWQIRDISHLSRPRDKEAYMLYVTPPAEIEVGMMISGAHPDEP